jgi:hypothetical protein
MAGDASHGQVRSAATVATVVESNVGTAIELPVRAGGWEINDITGQVVRATATAAQSNGGTMRMTSPSGDLTPDPNPSRWPVYESASFLGATAPVSIAPLHRYPLNIHAAGKANIQFSSVNAIAVAIAPVWSVGIHYAPEIIIPKIPRYSDFVRSTIAAVTRTQVGTIALSENATEIVGIMGVLIQNGALTTAEELVGFFDLDSDDVDIKPSQWLFNQAYGAGLGALIGGGDALPPSPHLVSIPVKGGADIDVFVTLTVAVTNPADVMIAIMYI